VPLHLTGTLGPDAQYVIDKPANWNGMLVVWAHGYTAPDDPIQLPNFGALGQFLLSQGFALAASSFSENGYAVAEGSRQTHQLAMVFSDLVAEPDRTFLVGVSLGSIIGLKILETHSHTYDGALLVATIGGGSDDEVRYLADVWVLFDKFFPDASLPPLFGERPGPYPQAQLVGLVTHPDNAQRFQLFLAFARERGLPFASGPEAVQATLTALGFAWIGALDFLDRTHGHVLIDNSETVYTAPGVPQPIVDDVNATVDRLTSTLDAEAYLRNYYEPDGDLRIPVITLHDQRDPLVPIFHEDLYQKVQSKGKSEFLRQYSVDAFGHVSPTLQGQIPGRFLELVTWANSLAATP
jgi:pimeloyl-ACP methyl ester carboxylesterase